MQRALGPQTVSGCLLQPSRRQHAACHSSLASRRRRPACQAASTLSNEESATGGPAGPIKAAAAAAAAAASTTTATSSATAASASLSPSAPVSKPTSSTPSTSASRPAPPPSATPAAPASPSGPATSTTATTFAATVSAATAPATPATATPSKNAAIAEPSRSEPQASSQAASQQPGPSQPSQPPRPHSDAKASAQPQDQAQQQDQQAEPPQPPPLVFSAAFLRRLAAASTPLDVAEALAEELPSGTGEEEVRAVLAFCMQRGKAPLALAIYKEMCQARRGGGAGRAAGGSGGLGGSGAGSAATRSLDAVFVWPPASLATTREVVLGLCQQLCTVEALQVLADMKVQGLPRGSDEVGFGKVVTSPLAPERPLTVVQPQEGAKTVADAFSRYEYDVFSGTTINCSSTALVPSGNLLFGLGRALGLIKKPPVVAVHEFVLQAPDSTSRTFRVGTESAAVPAQVGERVTVVSAPARNVRKGGLFNASPPGTRPGEALTATNHKTGVVLHLLRPPVSTEQAGGSIPSWVLPLAVVLAGGDAASSLLDPALPLLLAAGAASLAGGTVAGNTMLLPRLKQLPDGKVRVELVRQQLLGQYNALAGKASQALTESAEDVRVLARLWQLQNKMEAVSGLAAGTVAVAATAATGGGGAYEARIGRVARARSNIEERLARRIELLEGYSRVMNMIEIEVEMDIEVPAAELAGIEEQVSRLVELESVQEDWRAQAEARDEVERLLRAA